jgi:cell surface protein SprA
MYQYSVSSNLELGKLLPEKAGIRIPFYGGISQIFSTPEFDPYQLDVSSKDNDCEFKGQARRRFCETLLTPDSDHYNPQRIQFFRRSNYAES